MKFAARAVMALSLLLGVYVLAAAMVLVLGVAVYEGIVHGWGGLLLGKGAALLLVVALALGRALWRVRQTRGTEPAGLLLDPDDQPGLWTEVRSIAETVGTRPPDAIRLVPQVNASVWEDSRFLGLVAGRRVLTVGAPLALGLTRQQLRSVLAHELAHYSHRHTAMTAVVYRGHVTLGHLVESLGQDSLTGKVFAGYGRLYLRVTRSITRRQEQEADEWSHRIAGRAAAAGALREVSALDGLWDYFLDEYAFAVQGVRPDDLFAGFTELLASPQRRQQLAELASALPEEAQDPYDTHPTLRSRVEYFESLPDDGIVDDGTPATELLAGADTALRQLESEMFADAELEARPWPWIAEAAGIRRARANASLLVRATSEAGSGAATLQDALRILAQDDPRRLVRPFVAPDLPPDQVEAAATRLVNDVVAAALVEHCGARFALDWDANETLLDPDGRPVDVAGMVSSAVEGRSADWLIQALAEEGVPPSFAVDPVEVDAEATQGREPAVHSVVACVSWRRLRILVVADNGLIVKRMGFGEGFKASLKHGTMDPYRTAVHYVASIPLSQLLQDRRASVFGWERVGAVRLSGRRVALALNGRRHRMKIQSHAGDLAGSLEHHLGERLAIA